MGPVASKIIVVMVCNKTCIRFAVLEVGEKFVADV